MPCVFPILSLKALSLARAGESQAEARTEGLAYTAGILFFSLDSRYKYAHAIWHSFVVLGSGFHILAALDSMVS